jgi:hypothetical protein
MHCVDAEDSMAPHQCQAEIWFITEADTMASTGVGQHHRCAVRGIVDLVVELVIGRFGGTILAVAAFKLADDLGLFLVGLPRRTMPCGTASRPRGRGTSRTASRSYRAAGTT